MRKLAVLVFAMFYGAATCAFGQEVREVPSEAVPVVPPAAPAESQPTTSASPAITNIAFAEPAASQPASQPSAQPAAQQPAQRPRAKKPSVWKRTWPYLIIAGAAIGALVWSSDGE